MATSIHTVLHVTPPDIGRSKSALALKAKAKEARMNVDPTELQVQNVYMAYEVVYYLLNEKGVKLNGYSTCGQHQSDHTACRPCLREASFVEAFGHVKSISLSLNKQHGEEFMTHVITLDTRDEHLYGSYHDVLACIVKEEIRWGRLASLFVFTATLGNRLYKEGQQDKITCLIGWLGAFLNNDRVSEWLRASGGWAGINKVGRRSPVPVTKANKDAGTQWLTIAALGVGAFVIGALFQR